MKKYWILVCIVLLAAVLRFYQLGVSPPSLDPDEAAWGYNAYSLGVDGRDEFGKFLPVSYFESFGDFKPPVYAYLDVLPIKFLGLNVFATRFPSALFGTLTVLLTYFLVKRILYEKSDYSLHNVKQVKSMDKSVSKKKLVEYIALASAFILAISPWHIMLSRAAFEANVATFFLVFGVYAFLRGVQDASYFFIFAAVSFVLSMYTFNTERVVAPLLVIFLSIFGIKKLLRMKRIVITAAVIGFLLLLPSIPFLLSPQARLRYEEVNIFSDINLVKLSNQEIANAHNAWWAKILDNRRVIYGREFLKHYFDNLSFNFLFIQGDGNPKFSTQDVGQMYIWELPFLLLGLFFLIRYRRGWWYVIPVWLLLGIIPAATAQQTPHALRTEATLPTFQILVAYGVVMSLQLIKKQKKVFLSILAAAVVICLVYYLHGYYFHYPQEFSGEWEYGYRDSIAYVASVQTHYNHVVVTNALGRPYIYYLFYLKVPPRIYRKTADIHRDAFGFVTVSGFGKYQFPQKIQYEPGSTLYILGTSDPVPDKGRLLKTFYLLNGQPVLRAYQT